jgi:hypothetical protein
MALLFLVNDYCQDFPNTEAHRRSHFRKDFRILPEFAVARSYDDTPPGGRRFSFYLNRVRESLAVWNGRGTRARGGMQIPVVDIDGDRDLDVVTPGKSGLFFFEQIDSSKE